jgi:hypothetical protein
MLYKLLDYKLKWLAIGLPSGLFALIFLRKLFLLCGLKNEQNDDVLRAKNEHKFAEYSQWPPFLSDPTFDLV